MATQMLSLDKLPTGELPQSGLGPFVEGAGRGFRFGHGGANAGFQSDLVYFPESGQGAVIMTNSDQGGRLITELKLALAAEYGWPDFGPKIVKVVALDSLAIARLTGIYALRFRNQTFSVTVKVEHGKLIGSSPAFGESEELLPESALSLVGLRSGWAYQFTARDGQPASELEVRAGPAFVFRGPRQ